MGAHVYVCVCVCALRVVWRVHVSFHILFNISIGV